MQRVNIKCCHCGDYTPFITEENIELIPQANLTMNDMNTLNAIAELLASKGNTELASCLTHIQSEVMKIVVYQEGKE